MHPLLTLIEQALGLATQALFVTGQEPRVGCVIATNDGRVLGKGFRETTGGLHAEVMALREAAESGEDVRGATAYVTMEPSAAGQGGTLAGCDALVSAGIARVVASVQDPNPLVSGHGFARLRAAGIEVIVGPGAEAARELNIGFFSRMIRRTPWVRMKVAASLDGATALLNGQSQWITSRHARADGHAWRARACAVLTGIGTVLDDDPRMDVREVETQRQPHVVVIDSSLQLPLDARLLQVQRTCLVYAADPDPAKQSALRALGVNVISLPNTAGKVDLTAMLHDLAARGVNEVHVEAGHKLNGSLLREGLVDEVLLYLAPVLLGPGMGLAHLAPLSSLQQGQALEFTAVDRVGPDLRIRARPKGRDRF